MPWHSRLGDDEIDQIITDLTNELRFWHKVKRARIDVEKTRQRVMNRADKRKRLAIVAQAIEEDWDRDKLAAAIGVSPLWAKSLMDHAKWQHDTCLR